MKRIISVLALASVILSCTKEGATDTTDGNGNNGSAVPQVVASDVKTSSFTISWDEIEGVSEYRYEITCSMDGRNVPVAAENISSSSVTVEGLWPSATFNVRVATRVNGMTSTKWGSLQVKTAGEGEVSFTIRPVEKYTGGYVLPYAEVTPSDKEVYYWVGAVAASEKDSAADWIVEDIEYYQTEEGMTWDAMVEAGLILKGDNVSLAFNFNGYDDYHFIVAVVGKTLSGAMMVSDTPALSHQFWAEGIEDRIQHPSEYNDFSGEWVLKTSGTVSSYENGNITIGEGSSFPVRIASGDDSNTLKLTGWGGSENRFASYPMTLDYVEEEGYGEFSISFPQNIVEEGGVEWSYTSWFEFSGTVEGALRYIYYPYDAAMAESAPEWAVGFKGYIGNQNKTVIKIGGIDYTSLEGEGAYMLGIWPLGINQNNENVLLNDKYEEPVSVYYLVKKNVADGAVLEIPDSSPDSAASSCKVPAKVTKSVQEKPAYSHPALNCR